MKQQQEMIQHQQAQLLEQQRKVAEQAHQIEEAKKQATAARKSAKSVMKEAQVRNTASNDHANLADMANVLSLAANKSRGRGGTKPNVNKKEPAKSRKGSSKKSKEAQPSAAANKENVGPSIQEPEMSDSSNNVRHAVLCTTFSTCGCSNDLSIWLLGLFWYLRSLATGPGRRCTGKWLAGALHCILLVSSILKLIVALINVRALAAHIISFIHMSRKEDW